MKIKSVTTYILKVALGKERFYSSQCAFPERNSLLVRVDTDEGITGWGEGGQYGPPEPVASCIQSVLTPMIIHEDPRSAVKLWERMYSNTRDFGQKGTYIEAMSALDIALWDIFGKSQNVPIHVLLGGAFRNTISAYATGCYYREDDLIDYTKTLPLLKEEAKSFLHAGFNTIKIKMGLLSILDDIKRVKAIREVIGADTKMLVDCNHSYNAATAIQAGRALEEYDIGWLEEPVPPEDHDGYRRVRNNLSIPIAGGECEYTRFGFKDLIVGECVDIAQPDLCVCGGFSEMMKIIALASSFGIMVIPHVWGSGIAIAAALHVLAVIPPLPHTANLIPLQNEPVIEFDRSPNPLRDELLVKKITLIDGGLSVPQKPGLGVEIDMYVLKKYQQN